MEQVILPTFIECSCEFALLMESSDDSSGKEKKQAMATCLFVEETLTASLTSSPAPVSRRCHIWTGRYHAGTQWLSIRISADPLEQLCNHSPSTSLSTTLSRLLTTSVLSLPILLPPLPALSASPFHHSMTMCSAS